MGKSEHESFSFVGKSKLRPLTKDAKEKSGKKRFRGKNEKKSEVENKKKNQSWWKWMSFLGRRRRSLATPQPDKNSETVSDPPLDKWNDARLPEINLFGIPAKKKSKMLIEPTKSGIKAMIARCARAAPRPEGESGARDGARGKVGEAKRPKAAGRRLKWTSAIFKREPGMERTSDSLLKSALFIRQDVDETVECAVLFEPDLPKDCFCSRRSDEIIPHERFAETGGSPGSYGVLNDGKDEVVETFKTISEPTWNDRRQILRQQQLKDNINNLLEQFMCLEAEDVMSAEAGRGQREGAKLAMLSDFPGFSASKLTEVGDGVRWSKTSGLGLRELSREVSPEILINIKPFKEQQTEVISYPNNGTRREAKGEEKKRKMRGRPSGQLHFPIGTDVGDAEDSFYQIIKTPSESEWESDKNGGGYEESRGETSAQFKYKTSPKPSACTLRGARDTYSNRRDETKEEKEATEKRGERKGAAQLYEVLDNLDDADHDLVFRKNISQFRKKLAAMPRLDAVGGAMDASRTRKYSRAENPRRKKLEALRFECAERWEREQKSGKVLENVCLLLSQTELLIRTLATRIEAGVLQRSQTAREVRYMLENNGSTVLEKEVPARFEGKLRVVKLRRLEGERAGRGQDPVAELLAVRGGGFCRRVSARRPEKSLSETLRFLPNSTKRYYLLPEFSFYGFEQKHKTNPSGFEDDEKLTKPEEAEKDIIGKVGGKDGNIRRRTKRKLEFSQVLYEAPCSVVQVLNSSSLDYGIIIYDSEPPSLNVSTSGRSEGEGNVATRATKLSFPGGGEETGRWRNFGRLAEKQSDADVRYDGFQIIYNNSKDSLDDEEDATKVVFSRIPSGKKQSFIFATGESENKITGKKTNVLRPSARQSDKKALTYKSNSSPKENITQTEFLPKEHRARSSLVLSREPEKESQNFKKRRLSLDKGVDVRRTGSAMAEKDRPFLQKNSSFGNETFGGLLFPEELKTVLESERKSVERRKTLGLENGGTNVKKEILAAFNSIKELNAGKGETKGGKGRMSLVIMLSKK